MSDFADPPEALKQAVWAKAMPLPGIDPADMRRDALNTPIRFADYGDSGSAYGWEIDRIVPRAQGGSNNPSNLRPLNYQNLDSLGGMIGGFSTRR